MVFLNFSGWSLDPLDPRWIRRLQVLYLGHHQRPPGGLRGPRACLPLEGRCRNGDRTQGGDQSHQNLERGEVAGRWSSVEGKETGWICDIGLRSD